jgi:hypothetical protein
MSNVADERAKQINAVGIEPGMYAFKDGPLWAVCDIDADGPAAGEIRNKRWMPKWWTPERRFGFVVRFTDGSYMVESGNQPKPRLVFQTEFDAHGATVYGRRDRVERIYADPQTGAEVPA